MLFYGRTKVRLATLGNVRGEMGIAYRSAVRGELTWEDLKAAIYALLAIARIDEGPLIEQRIAALEERLGARPAGRHHIHPGRKTFNGDDARV
jgi:hypothetical protein